MTLYQQFSQVLDEQKVMHGKIIVGFSGGVDSRVLLRLAARYSKQHSITCLAVHVHHGLSDNANEWQVQCERWAQEEAVEFTCERVTLSQDSGESLEQLARQARYQALRQHMQSGDILLTGQHLDDQAETMLLALKRGSGPKGLSSMASSMNFGSGRLVRPLLNIARHDIERYAQHEQLQWVEDESNSDTRFDRNFLRQSVLPVLNQRWPSFAKAASRSARLCAKQERLIKELLLPELEVCMNEFQGLSISTMSSHSILKREQLLRLWLEANTSLMPTEVQLCKIWQEVVLAKQDANPEMNLAGGAIRRAQGHLYWVEAYKDVSDWQQSWLDKDTLVLPDNLGVLKLVSPSKDAKMTLDRQTLNGSLKVIFNPEGLSAHPHGRAGSRKLKKLFQELKIPSWQRRRIPILIQDDKVVAVGNLFVDKAFYGSDCELVWDK
ncbi:tRNA lysidine(34) synthetase TilS [Vibrio mediterranei]|uniref:tRNA lysidine(34) synthetase TilS n=1 Tax=Vibrio mediterranei TaxID=689 RepID=UPI001EFE0F0F|nr:tRNA lysidine(34) synthetase TilS [Vibrio mediterranei]MCG9665766.1 tRNA lysidine(34) synthetase TilS [Vibrio mediterranei]